VIQSGGDDFVLGVGDQEDGQYGDYVDLDEEICQLQGIDLEVSTVPLFNFRAGARGVSLENAGVFALSTGIQAPPLHAAALCSDDHADGSLFALGRTDIFSSATVLSVQANGQALSVTSGKRDGRYGQLVHDFSYETSGLYNAGIRSDCDGPYSPRGVYGAYQNYGSYGGTPTGNAMGVRGYTGDSGTNRYGVFSSGNFGCSGEKYFLQPHPTDPSKQVRFACLEGNESGTSFPLNPESTYPVL
jgi:hypothetical protein